MSVLVSQDPVQAQGHGDIVGDRDPDNFNNVVPEIYLKIVKHLHSANDLANLSKACRRFRDLAIQDGWRVFVQTSFPSLIGELPSQVENTPIEWIHLAQSLTTQSRAWDKRAVSAVLLNIDSALVQITQHLHRLSSRKDSTPGLLKWDRESNNLSLFQVYDEEPVQQQLRAPQQSSPRQQSTPFHPAIDTRLEFSGKLCSKQEVVAWSTGPEVFVRVRRSGSFVPQQEDNPYDNDPYHDEYSNRLNMLNLQHYEFRSGIHDITTINILEPSLLFRESFPYTVAVDFIGGRASGHLHRYSVSNAEPDGVVVNTFHSFEKQGSLVRRSVRSADINKKTGTSLLAACSDKAISLYETEVESHDVWPVSELEIDLNLLRSQAWAVRFSSPENLLLGLGQSIWPLHAYNVTPTGLILTEKLGDKCNIANALELTSKSVYAIEPLSGVPRAGGSSNGDVFLSGCYDGICRLYDRRAGPCAVQLYHDPIASEGAIYSLVSFGHERFLAGSANSGLMTFDFRNSSKAYYYTDALPCSEFRRTHDQYPGSRHNYEGGRDITALWNSNDGPVEDCQYFLRTNSPRACHYHQYCRTNMYGHNTNIFLYGAPRELNARTHTMSRNEKSPIFSLSSPSSISPVVYAGTAGTVYELEISETDSTGNNLLDPYFAAPPGAAVAKLNQVELVMYEMDHGDPGPSVPKNLYVQIKGRRRRNENFASNRRRLDMRWQLKSEA